MAATYPGTFPCPMIEGYSIEVDAGVIRSKERGLPAQRRTFTTLPHTIKCKFALSLREWAYWQEWITKIGYGWFWIDLPSMYAGQHARRTFPHMVRVNAPITVDAKSATHVFASVTLDLSPSTFKHYLDGT